MAQYHCLVVVMINEKYFKETFYKNYQALLGFAYTFVRSREVAEELVQDVFFNVWQKRNQISSSVSISSYLHAATKNVCLNYLKSKYHRDHSGFLEISKVKEVRKEAHDQLVFKELEDIIEKGIDLLPDKCRVIFILSRDQGMSYHEIAAHLMVSKETVKSQIKIAVRKLKDHLIQNGFSYP